MSCALRPDSVCLSSPTRLDRKDSMDEAAEEAGRTRGPGTLRDKRMVRACPGMEEEHHARELQSRRDGSGGGPGLDRGRRVVPGREDRGGIQSDGGGRKSV